MQTTYLYTVAEKSLGCFEPAENFDMVNRTWPIYDMHGVIHLQTDLAATRILQQPKDSTYSPQKMSSRHSRRNRG